MPPRTANSPRCSTWCSRRYPFSHQVRAAGRRRRPAGRAAPRAVPWPSRGPIRCSRARTGVTITRGARGQAVVGLRRQRVQDGQPPPHRLGLGADPLEGQRLPGRQDGRPGRPGRRRDRPPRPASSRQARSSPSRSASRPVGVTTTIGPRSPSAASAAVATACAASGTATVASAAPMRPARAGSARRSRGRAPRLPAPGSSGRPGRSRLVAGGGHGGGRRGAAAHRLMAWAASGTTAWLRRCHPPRCARSSRPPSPATMPSTSRTALGGRRRTCDAPWAALGGLPTPMRTRRKSLVCRCDGDGTQPVVARQSPAGLEPHRARRQVELVVHDDDGGRVLDAEARGQAAHGETGLVHVGRRDGQRHPAPGHGRHGDPGRHALLGPQGDPVALGQQLHRVGRPRCAGCRRIRGPGCPARRPAGRPGCPGAPTGRRVCAGPSPLRTRPRRPPRPRSPRRRHPRRSRPRRPRRPPRPTRPAAAGRWRWRTRGPPRW